MRDAPNRSLHPTAAAIRSLEMLQDDAVSMNVAINKNGLSPEDAARSWLETHAAR